MGGVPSYWRTGRLDASSDPKWQKVYRRLGVLSPWSVGRFADDAGADGYRTIVLEPDLAATRAHARGLYAGAVSRIFIRQHQSRFGPVDSDQQPDSARMRPLLLAPGV